MVESNHIITIFFGQFDSQYVGSPYMIGGNQIYSAIIKEKGISYSKELKKVSYGIFHEIQKNSADWKGWSVKPYFTKEKKLINLNNKTISTYKDFFQLRNYHTPFIKDVSLRSEPDRIMDKHKVRLRDGSEIDLLLANKLSFFTISDCAIDLDNLNLQFGAKRNTGFGLFTVTDSYSFSIESLDYSMFGEDKKLIGTAKEGIYGILNHQKYGYGEFKIEKGADNWWIKLTTPLCLESTIRNTRSYTTPPSFMQGDRYRKQQDSIWRENKIERLFCISDGSVFKYNPNTGILDLNHNKNKINTTVI